MSKADMNRLLPDRQANSHKGNFGRILLLCGSVGYTGAAALAAMGALRCGAGLLYLAVPERIYEIEATKLTEPIILPLPDQNGMLSTKAVPAVQELLTRMDVVLIGPGLGQSEGTKSVLQAVLNNFTGPVIIDADGITMLSAHKDILRGRTSPTIITPHPGEFRRLADLGEDRVNAAVSLARDLDVVVLLKGHNSVITDGNQCFVNTTGNPGMATGGSGDVLAGMIAGLIGQGIDPLLATAAGAWIHGAAGDICAKEIGQYGMLPTDMLEVIPRLMK